MNYGNGTDKAIVGDWNGDGIDSFGVRRADTFLLRNDNTAGVTQITAKYGLTGDTVGKGDFDRAGSINRGDGIAVIR